LDKFNLDEMIIVFEIDEQEVTALLSELLNEKIIIKNNNTYFFNIKNKRDKGNIAPKTEIKPIIIEKEEGYDYFLTLSKETKERIRSYIELLNFVNQAGVKIQDSWLNYLTRHQVIKVFLFVWVEYERILKDMVLKVFCLCIVPVMLKVRYLKNYTLILKNII